MFINLISLKNRDEKLNVTKNAVVRYKNKTTAAAWRATFAKTKRGKALWWC
jgi:hypothetical protein